MLLLMQHPPLAKSPPQCQQSISHASSHFPITPTHFYLHYFHKHLINTQQCPPPTATESSSPEARRRGRSVVLALPTGGALLALAGITLLGTLAGLALATPLFLLFSPVIVPAAAAIWAALAAILASGALGAAGLCSLSRAVSCAREAMGTAEEVKRKLREAPRKAVKVSKGLGLAAVFLLVMAVNHLRAAVRTATEEPIVDQAETAYLGEKTLYSTAHSGLGPMGI